VVDLFAWVKGDWFSVAQTIGIVGGLYFTGMSCRQVAKAQETRNLLAFAERHRALWAEAYRPELNRIFSYEADVLAKPVSIIEEEFLNVIFVHFEMGWRLAKSSDHSDLKPLALDIRDFFSRPLPNAVWEKTKKYRNPKFVRFAEKALSDHTAI
jgi:hypothetical protein